LQPHLQVRNLFQELHSMFCRHQIYFRSCISYFAGTKSISGVAFHFSRHQIHYRSNIFTISKQNPPSLHQKKTSQLRRPFESSFYCSLIKPIKSLLSAGGLSKTSRTSSKSTSTFQTKTPANSSLSR